MAIFLLTLAGVVAYAVVGWSFYTFLVWLSLRRNGPYFQRYYDAQFLRYSSVWPVGMVAFLVVTLYSWWEDVADSISLWLLAKHKERKEKK